MNKKINDKVYYSGVLNPNMRVFDVIMNTEYGTSYNSYLIKGENKTALIETAHHDYFDYFYSNIKEIVDPAKIDYLIMNHNEPDHSGSINKLLEAAPQIEVISSAGGGIYLKNIVGRKDLKVKTVKTGDTLDLGGATLEFINAPFLHWPDSMFTYLKEDKIVFSCDFLGCHFCEPQIMDFKTKHLPQYLESLKYYYTAIFSPFARYVRQGINKVKELDVNMVCPSHGPVLTKEGLLKNAIDSYSQWSIEEKNEVKQIPIFYCSAYGNTKQLAESIKSGIESVLKSADVKLYNVIEEETDVLGNRLNKSDAFLLGSPTINKDALPPIWELLTKIDAINIQKRPAALFGSYGWSGEALPNLEARLKSLKVNVFDKKFRAVFVPTKKDLEEAFGFGEEFAKSLG